MGPAAIGSWPQHSPYCDVLNLIMRVLALGLTRAIFVVVQCRRTDLREAPWRWMATGSDREARSIAALPAALSPPRPFPLLPAMSRDLDRKSTRLNSSHVKISYAV